jgi:hypothetical protein
MRRLVGTAVFVGCSLVAGSRAAATPAAVDVSTTGSAVAAQQAQPEFPAVPDDAAMVVVGAVLIALGTAVRRAA